MSHWIITGWPASSISSSDCRALRRTGRALRFDLDAGALPGDLLQGRFESAAPAHEGRLPFEMPVAEAHPGAQAQQHLLAEVVVVVDVDVAHRAGDAVVRRKVLKSCQRVECHLDLPTLS